jgi:urease accessory protein
MRSLLIFFLVAAATPAFAHTGVGTTVGIADGFFHPLGGVDHILAMVGVGLFATVLGGRALWLVPLSFVVMMAAGGALGMMGIAIPYVEIGIACSVVALGAMLTFQWKFPAAVAAALVGLFAIFHGHAHGAEMPDSASGLQYGAGFVLATVLLHCAGIAVGVVIGLLSGSLYPRITQAAGAAMAIAGIAMLSAFI